MSITAVNPIDIGRAQASGGVTKRELTQEYVRSIFSYDPESGILRWRISPHPNVRIGDEAGNDGGDGYKKVSIKNKNYKVHRIIWLYTHGYFPEHVIDHINRNPSDNKISNLREVSQVCNMRNTGNTKSNSSGVKGVSWDRSAGKWRSHITVNKKTYYLGCYKGFDNAVCARLMAEQCLGWAGCESISPAYQYVKKNIQQTSFIKLGKPPCHNFNDCKGGGLGFLTSTWRLS